MTILKLLKPIKDRLDELSFGEILVGTRELLGMKQGKLAEMLEISIPVIKSYEVNSYKSDPHYSVVLRFCTLFDYPFEHLYRKAIEREHADKQIQLNFSRTKLEMPKDHKCVFISQVSQEQKNDTEQQKQSLA